MPVELDRVQIGNFAHTMIERLIDPSVPDPIDFLRPLVQVPSFLSFFIIYASFYIDTLSGESYSVLRLFEGIHTMPNIRRVLP